MSLPQGIAVLLLALLVGTVLRQLPVVSSSRWMRWDSLGFFPGFSFFAPHPGSHDYSLVYRTRQDGELGNWHDPLHLARRSPWTALWNPAKRLRKLIIDASGALAHEMVKRAPDDPHLRLSLPYLLLLQYVSGLSPRQASHVQFAVLASAGPSGHKVYEVLLLSHVHEL